MVFAEQIAADRDASSDDSRFAVVLRSPGQVDMAGISALASALKQPVGLVSKRVYQAPSVLMRDINPQHQTELAKQCAALGLDFEFKPNDVQLPKDERRYDVAVHIDSADHIPMATEELARLLGVTPEKAFRLLATPPGLIIGDVSLAAADALARRFGQGCVVSASVSGDGPFDLFLPKDARIDQALDERCRGQRGLVMLGLDTDQAKDVFSRLPKGSARLIPRSLLRFDLLLVPQNDISDTAKRWMIDMAGCIEDDIPLLLAHAPVALREGVDYVEATKAGADAAQSGLKTVIEAYGFLRSHITVTEAPDRAALIDILGAAGLDVPPSFPARIAENLPDLDARWLAYQLEMIGASFLFEEADA